MKQLLKKTLSVFTRCLPKRFWISVRNKFMVSRRKSGKIYSYIERMVNNLNRDLIIDQCVKDGIIFFTNYHNVPRRHIYEYIFDKYVNEPIDYLEFGVADGGSMRVALKYLKPECNLYGFDSFEGLPENWFQEFQKKAFDRGG